MKEKKEIIVTWSQKSTIVPTMIRNTIAIYNKKHIYLFI